MDPEETSVEFFGDHLWVSRLLSEGFVSLLCQPHENIPNKLGKVRSRPASWRLSAFRVWKTALHSQQVSLGQCPPFLSSSWPRPSEQQQNVD